MIRERKKVGKCVLGQKSVLHLSWVIRLNMPVHGDARLAAHGTRLSERLVVMNPPDVHLHVTVVLSLEAAQFTLNGGLVVNVADMLF